MVEPGDEKLLHEIMDTARMDAAKNRRIEENWLSVQILQPAMFDTRRTIYNRRILACATHAAVEATPRKRRANMP
jgi:hypothetical protein